MRGIFHLALHVHDLGTALSFYRDVLGCTVGRSGDTWVDLNFFGHQLSLHLGTPQAPTHTGVVDGHTVPMPHFGAILSMADWQTVADRLTTMEIQFILPPMIRFSGQSAEQGTLFLADPSGNVIELKGFHDMLSIF